MARLHHFVQALGGSLCEFATAALARLVPFETALLDTARSLHRRLRSLPPTEIRTCLRELVSAPPETVELALQDGVNAIRPEVAEEFRDTLFAYLELLPELARQALRRPGDPEGVTVDEQFTIRRPEDWLSFLPDRLPAMKQGDMPVELDEWRLEELRGMGPHAEIWNGYDDDQPELSPACLKFATDPAVREVLYRSENLLRQVLDLDVMTGIIPMRSAYLGADPPCLEYVHLHGYDLTNLMNDAQRRGERSRPDQAARVIRRAARVIGKLHRRQTPIVHRGLKPSNILLCPTGDGNAAVWISDLGWGQITAQIGLRGLDPAQAIRRALRGSHGPLYASPQVAAGDKPAPTDDVYSLGVIWYQLLHRDPSAVPSANPEWATEFRRHGFSDGQAALLTSCLANDPSERPRDGQHLAELIAVNLGSGKANDSNAFRLKGTSGFDFEIPPMKSDRPRLRMKGDSTPPPRPPDGSSEDPNPRR